MTNALRVLALLLLAGCGDNPWHRATPPFGVVPDSEGKTTDTLIQAIADWNNACDQNVFYLDRDAKPGLPEHVYVRLAPLPVLAGQATSDDESTWNVYVRPDYVTNANTLRHELGHVLSGSGHSSDAADLMWSGARQAGVRVPISAGDMARVTARFDWL